MKKVRLLVNDYKDSEIEAIKKTYNLTEITAKILLNRQLGTIEDIDAFLNPDFKYFEDATVYKDLEKGCQRILEAIRNNERILIYGDYDVDGVTSISQFMMVLKKAGADADYYVPERESEGYGISSSFIRELSVKKRHVDLLITVDCGIAEANSIKEIMDLGVEVIVLDHHQCMETVPKAYAVINPKQPDCMSKNKQLCAAGLSFKFLRYMNTFLKIDGIEDKLLELACLGTIADIVDLIGDNRIITYNGLKVINHSSIMGIRKLIEKAGIGDKQIEAYHIGYILAPRINAAGRMSTAKKAVRLMLTEDEAEADMLASELESLNVLRKDTEFDIFNEAVTKIEAEASGRKNIIVVCGADWHEGVLGIVASKITEKYEKPSIVISVKDGIGKGSARSMSWLDIHDALKNNDGYLLKYGGHKLAAGLTIEEDKISEFTAELNKYVARTVSDDCAVREINVDSYIENKDVTDKLFDELYMLEPYGHGNPKPVFAVKNFSINNVKRVGKNLNHISFAVGSADKSVAAIGFDKMELLNRLLTKPRALVVNINGNEFKGNRYLQYVLVNVEESDSPEYAIDEAKAKIISTLIGKSKSKIMKTDLFKLVDRLNNSYNVKTSAEEIVCILKKDANIEYVLKSDILYIKIK